MVGRFEGKVHEASLRRLTRRFASMPERAARDSKVMLKSWGEAWRSAMLDRVGRGGDGGLATRTGALKRSLRSGVEGSGLSDLRLRNVSAGVAYARVQEEGGEIRPQNGRYLTIPLDAAKTAAGVARFSARQFIDSHPGETFFARKGDRLTLMWAPDKVKSGGPTSPGRFAVNATSGGTKAARVIPMFALVRKVEIPGPKAPTKKRPSRMGFFDTWRGQARDRRADLVRLARSIGGGR